MRIAIDYDDTYTCDPKMWDDIIEIMQDDGHEVVCVTSRRSTFENRLELDKAEVGFRIPVVFCNYNPKAEFMRVRGEPVDIWIDDNPHTIDPDGKEQKPQYAKWKNSGK